MAETVIKKSLSNVKKIDAAKLKDIDEIDEKSESFIKSDSDFHEQELHEKKVDSDQSIKSNNLFEKSQGSD